MIEHQLQVALDLTKSTLCCTRPDSNQIVLVAILPLVHSLQTSSPFYDATTTTVGSTLPRYPQMLAGDRNLGLAPYGYQSSLNPALGGAALQQPLGLYGAQQNLGYYGSLGTQQPFLNNDPRLALLQDPQLLSYLASQLSSYLPGSYGSLGSSAYLRGQDPYLMGNRGYMGQFDPTVSSLYGSPLGSQYGLDGAAGGYGGGSYPSRYSSYGYQQSYPYGSASTLSSSTATDKAVKRDPKFRA